MYVHIESILSTFIVLLLYNFDQFNRQFSQMISTFLDTWNFCAEQRVAEYSGQLTNSIVDARFLVIYSICLLLLKLPNVNAY